VAQVREATGIFLIGGEQDKIVKALFTSDGEQSPMLKAMWEVYRNGGVIANSAGAAVMSRVMFRDAESVLDTMLKGVRWGKEIDRGLGSSMTSGSSISTCLCVVASHERWWRCRTGIQFGIGVDENSAIIIKNGKDVVSSGTKGPW